MGKHRPTFHQRRCVCCGVPTRKTFSIVDNELAPKIHFCTRHFSELEKIGIGLFVQKFDFVAIYISAYGYMETPAGFIWKDDFYR